jgi:hypothetical protein
MKKCLLHLNANKQVYNKIIAAILILILLILFIYIYIYINIYNI